MKNSAKLKIPEIKKQGNEITNKSLLEIGKYIANTAAERVKKAARKGTLGELTGRTGATGDKIKTGDDIADKVIWEMKPYFSRQGAGSVYVYSEEEGVYNLVDAGEKGFFIVIDPLDGSNNLRKGVVAPYVSVSVALGRLSDLSEKETLDSVRVGVVRDIFNNRLYYAAKGRGSAYAYDIHDGIETRLRTFDVEDSKVTVYTESKIEKSIAGIDIDRAKWDDKEKIRKEMQERLKVLSPFIHGKKCQRRLGSSILDFCKVACGEYDFFISLGGRMKLHDLAAASRIIEESGGFFETDEPYEGNLLCDAFGMDDPKKAAELLKDTRFKAGASANPYIRNDAAYSRPEK